MLVVAALFSSCGDSKSKESKSAVAQQPGALPVTHNPERQQAIGPEACIECHQAEVEDWMGTDHALANMPLDTEEFGAAFAGVAGVQESGVTYQPTLAAASALLKVLRPEGGVTDKYPLTGILGIRPLWQALVPFPNGGWQVTSIAFDPIKKEWFDIFEGENRQPGEWGHWTGRGMNWNANCAYCHMTEFEKNYEPLEGKYRSTWLQHGVSCAQCHNSLETHVAAARAGDPTKGLTTLTTYQVIDSCAT